MSDIIGKNNKKLNKKMKKINQKTAQTTKEKSASDNLEHSWGRVGGHPFNQIICARGCFEDKVFDLVSRTKFAEQERAT